MHSKMWLLKRTILHGKKKESDCFIISNSLLSATLAKSTIAGRSLDVENADICCYTDLDHCAGYPNARWYRRGQAEPGCSDMVDTDSDSSPLCSHCRNGVFCSACSSLFGNKQLSRWRFFDMCRECQWCLTTYKSMDQTIQEVLCQKRSVLCKGIIVFLKIVC